jgi:peptide/nickel transport system substrate-binding protein
MEAAARPGDRNAHDEVRAHGRLLRLVVMLAVGILLAGACSSAETISGETPATSAVGDADPDATLRVGYNLLQQNVPLEFDPVDAKAHYSGNDALFYLIYGRLLRPTSDGGLEPDLAESVEIVDKSTIEVRLREGLAFSDGSPLDAAAVKASLDAVVANKASSSVGLPPSFFSLGSVEVVSPTQLRLLIPNGTASSWFDEHIPTWTTSIIKADDHSGTAPIGAGPYTVASYQPGQRLVLERNPSFWNADAITLPNQLEFVHFPPDQPQVGIAALKTGEADLTFTDPDQLPSLTAPLDSFARISPGLVVQMDICKAEGPLADSQVRRAINKAIDREAISAAVYNGEAGIATQIWPEGHRFYNPDLADDLAYDPAAAKQLLAEAGYANGFEVDLYPIQIYGLGRIAEILVEQLGEIGVSVTIVNGSNFVTDFLQPQRRALGLRPGGTSGIDRLNAWSGESIGNTCKYQSAELDALITQLRDVSSSSDEAEQLWHETAEVVVGDALSGFIVFRPDFAAYNTETIGDLGTWPLGVYTVPDPYMTYARRG